MRLLNGRTALITGAGGGLGSALASQLALEGCHLALVDIASEPLTSLTQSLSRHPVRISTHLCDISDSEAVSTLHREVLSVHGSVDILINNAGITLQKTFASHSLKDWQRILGVNLNGPLYLTSAFLNTLRQSDQGHIINLSSMAAFTGLPSQSSYCSSKAAIHLLSQTLRAELAAEKIGVTSVHPGAIRTDMIKATLDEADDLDQALTNFKLAQRFGVSADHAARKIVRAIQKDKRAIRIGMDAHLLYLLSRIMPDLLNGLITQFYRRHASTTKMRKVGD